MFMNMSFGFLSCALYQCMSGAASLVMSVVLVLLTATRKSSDILKKCIVLPKSEAYYN